MMTSRNPHVGEGPPGAPARSACHVLLVGPPGSGKSSQGVSLASRLDVSHISTGALLRDEVRRGSPVGRQAADYMRAGSLVPDWLVVYALELCLSDALAAGFVLDGYPRTLEQTEHFMRSIGGAELDRVIELATPDDVVVARLMARAVCDHCGQLGDTAQGTTCRECDGTMQRRIDDDEPVIRCRLATYHAQTQPMLGFFRDAGLLATIDGDRSRDVVAADVFRLVSATAP